MLLFVVVVGFARVIVVVVVDLAGWTKGEQVASSTGLGPLPCPLLASGDNGSFPGLVPLLQRNKAQRKGVRNKRLHAYSLIQDEGSCETPPRSDFPTSAPCSVVPKP